MLLQLMEYSENFPMEEEMQRYMGHKVLSYLHTITKLHSWKISENSPHMVSLRCLAFACVIWPLEKSNTSSLQWKREVSEDNTKHCMVYLNSFKTIMLFWQSDSLVLLAPTISLINVGQLWGHSYLTICIIKNKHIQ